MQCSQLRNQEFNIHQSEMLTSMAVMACNTLGKADSQGMHTENLKVFMTFPECVLILGSSNLNTSVSWKE